MSSIQLLVLKIQRFVFYTSLIIIPVSVLPLPWDLTEYSMGLLLSIFASTFLLLEMIKIVLSGGIKIYKTSWDVVLFLIILSLIFSTLFSQSLSVSLWGFDYRLGSGAVITILSILYMYSARSLLKKEEDIFLLVKYLSYGISISAVISILSFFGYNILSFIPSFRELFTTGLPFYSSARVSILIWSITMIMNLGIVVYFAMQKKERIIIPYWVVIIITGIATLLFSINQGGNIVIFSIIAMILIFTLPFIKKRPLNKYFVWIMLSVIVLFTGLFALTRSQGIQELLFKDDVNVITQVSLDNDISWKVASSSVSQTVTQGLFGMGVDTFSVAYNLFRPFSEETIILNNTNFTYAGNNILNILSSLGVVGLLVFMYATVVAVKNIVNHIKILPFEKPKDFLLFFFDVAILLILFSSFLTYYTFIIFFLLFTLFTVQGYFEGKELNEIRMDFASGGLRKDSFGIVVSVIAVLVFIVLFSALTKQIVSTTKILKAETLVAESQQTELSTEERNDLLVEVMDLYGNAASLNKSNPLIHRRTAILVSQYIQSLAEQYNSTDEVELRDTIFNSIASYTEVMIDETDKATDLSPQVYANWVARSEIYTNLVGLGLTTYTHSALSSLQDAVALNPLNYELYYSASQLYIVQNDVDAALIALNQVFSINGRHIPSLILAGELSASDGDLKQTQRYYTQAKETMEEFDTVEGEIYEYIVGELVKLSGEQIVEEENKGVVIDEYGEVLDQDSLDTE